MKKFDPQRFRSAVMVIARMRAKKAVVAQLRAQGLKPQHYSASDLTLMAEEYIAKHCEDLITNAIADVWMFPEFSRYRPSREQRRSRYGLLSLSHQANSIEFKLGLRKRLQLGWGICGWPFAQSA
jgi:hypothetical protein